jgi:hypothetical protein
MQKAGTASWNQETVETGQDNPYVISPVCHKERRWYD